MQAIETQFQGYRFRSRLEARWAVFFDAMTIKWEYESEGFVLEDGTMYLPDFYLPDWNCYAEVKPNRFTIDEFLKASKLPGLCLLLDFAPANRPYYIAGTVDSSYSEYCSESEYGRLIFEWSVSKQRLWLLLGESYENYNCFLTEQAVIRARSARFEFGETPA